MITLPFKFEINLCVIFDANSCQQDIHRGGKLVDGMIVDRNVLMFKRVREEARPGRARMGTTDITLEL